MAENWSLLADLPSTAAKDRTWIRNRPEILHFMEKNKTKKASIVAYYAAHKLASGVIPPTTHNGTNYNAFGHPEFENSGIYGIPKINGEKVGYQPGTLTGASSDVTKARDWFISKYNNPNIVKKSTADTRIMIYEPNSPYAVSGWVDCVMHHHEDAKTILPIPYDLHKNGHTGGNAILNNHQNLIGVFDSPNGVVFKK